MEKIHTYSYQNKFSPWNVGQMVGYKLFTFFYQTIDPERIAHKKQYAEFLKIEIDGKKAIVRLNKIECQQKQVVS